MTENRTPRELVGGGSPVWSAFADAPSVALIEEVGFGQIEGERHRLTGPRKRLRRDPRGDRELADFRVDENLVSKRLDNVAWSR